MCVPIFVGVLVFKCVFYVCVCVLSDVVSLLCVCVCSFCVTLCFG